MAAEGCAGTPGEAVADVLPLDRDPSRFPFGLLLVAPGLFEAVSGFNWFATEADALHFLREGVWPMLDLPEAKKQECQMRVAGVLPDGAHLDGIVLAALGTAQNDLIVVWAGRFEGMCDGSDDIVLSFLRDTALEMGNPELLGTPEGLLQLLPAYRWQYTGGIEGVRGLFGSLPRHQQQRFLDEIGGVLRNTELPTA